jgi:hypothetical protein
VAAASTDRRLPVENFRELRLPHFWREKNRQLRTGAGFWRFFEKSEVSRILKKFGISDCRI